MDIHENEEQLDENEPVSGEAPEPEQGLDSGMIATEIGDEIQPAPEVEEEGAKEEPSYEEDPPAEDTLQETEMDSEVNADQEDSAEVDAADAEAVVEDEGTPDEIQSGGDGDMEELPETEVQPVVAAHEPAAIDPKYIIKDEEDSTDPYAAVTAQEETAQVPDDGRAWYVVHCYSGNEDKVRHNILQRIESMSMDDLIFDVVVPTEDEVNIKNGERQTVEKKVFPGYILVNMILTEESWYMVRNTPGVTGFVGMGNDPTPLQPEEVARILKRMESESPRINVTFRAGERVRIVDGPFEDFYGKVAEIDMERATVRVMVNFFGRETPVELDFLQVEQA